MQHLILGEYTRDDDLFLRLAVIQGRAHSGPARTRNRYTDKGNCRPRVCTRPSSIFDFSGRAPGRRLPAGGKTARVSPLSSGSRRPRRVLCQKHLRQFPFSPYRWAPWRAVPDGGARIRVRGRLGSPCGGPCSRLPGGWLAVRRLLARSARLRFRAGSARPRLCRHLDRRPPEQHPPGPRIQHDRLLGRRPDRRRCRHLPAPCLRGAGQSHGHRHRRPGAVPLGQRPRRRQPCLRRPAGRRHPDGHGRRHPGRPRHGLQGERGA